MRFIIQKLVIIVALFAIHLPITAKVSDLSSDIPQLVEKPHNPCKDIEHSVQAISSFSQVSISTIFGSFCLNQSAFSFSGDYAYWGNVDLTKQSFSKLITFKLLYPFHGFV
ncbi:MAG: hypothetical protein MH472_07460 [Bacteroidia bacterium]|nr:hypothetical protein [Bacteroidia bacterium]